MNGPVPETTTLTGTLCLKTMLVAVDLSLDSEAVLHVYTALPYAPNPHAFYVITSQLSCTS